jgi:hypothetical protein
VGNGVSCFTVPKSHTHTIPQIHVSFDRICSNRKLLTGFRQQEKGVEVQRTPFILSLTRIPSFSFNRLSIKIRCV